MYGWAIFSTVFRLSQKARKKKVAFPSGPPHPTPNPTPNLSAFTESTKLPATFGDRVFISATGNKHNI